MSNKDANLVSTCVLGVNLLLWCLLSPSAAEGLQQITGRLGSNIVLQCQGTQDVKLLKWTKPDLKSEYYVYLFRNEQSEVKYQHQSFRGRVELRDPGMKSGDATLILKNVTINDTGTYECHVGYEGRPELTSSIHLTVVQSGGGAGHTEDGGDKDGGDKDGHVGLVAGLSFVGVLVLAACITGGFVIYKKHKGRSSY
ncbi:hypothetical protein Q5P01_003007 [Channa striata]|uniref:Ig-like domain-containing protein n=1 Tax=Channa striata TaxID=64152 RepID=A0AA88NSM4_CHASR|nr:hypothetical protein Q5P01_003007 [Channa striata]